MIGDGLSRRHSAKQLNPALGLKECLSMFRWMCWQIPVALIQPIATVVLAMCTRVLPPSPSKCVGAFQAKIMSLFQLGGSLNT